MPSWLRPSVLRPIDLCCGRALRAASATLGSTPYRYSNPGTQNYPPNILKRLTCSFHYLLTTQPRTNLNSLALDSRTRQGALAIMSSGTEPRNRVGKRKFTRAFAPKVRTGCLTWYASAGPQLMCENTRLTQQQQVSDCYPRLAYQVTRLKIRQNPTEEMRRGETGLPALS